MIRALRTRETLPHSRRRTFEGLMEARRAHLRALFRETTDALVRGETLTGSQDNDETVWVRNRPRAIYMRAWIAGLLRSIQVGFVVRRTWINTIAIYDIDDHSIEWFDTHRVNRHCSLRTPFGAFLRDLFEHPERVALWVH